MRQAKNHGGGSLVHAGNMTRHAPPPPFAGGRAEGLIRSALENDSFRLVFQPVVDRSDRIVLMEALIRIQDRSLGLVPPAEFIGAAERTGLIHEMGSWILAEACRHARTWGDAGYPVQVAVNVSPVELEKAGFVDRALQSLQNSGLEPGSLVFEVGDAQLTAPVRATLAAAKAAGVRIGATVPGLSMDEVDMLKVPFEQCRELGPHGSGRVAVTCIEEAAQLDQARLLGYDLFQGYWIAPPLDPDDAMQFLIQRNQPSDRRQDPVSQREL
jgi:EAL domain-containing protein (putative c-di-GMP-specific phosphodiesterase class I)